MFGICFIWENHYTGFSSHHNWRIWHETLQALKALCRRGLLAEDGEPSRSIAEKMSFMREESLK